MFWTRGEDKRKLMNEEEESPFKTCPWQSPWSGSSQNKVNWLKLKMHTCHGRFSNPLVATCCTKDAKSYGDVITRVSLECDELPAS